MPFVDIVYGFQPLGKDLEFKSMVINRSFKNISIGFMNTSFNRYLETFTVILFK